MEHILADINVAVPVYISVEAVEKLPDDIGDLFDF